MVSEDYFAAMSRVEQRLEIAPKPELENETTDEVVKVPEETQIISWIDRLALPELCQVERLEIADQLKRA
jgi:hypothetical protein